MSKMIASLLFVVASYFIYTAIVDQRSTEHGSNETYDELERIAFQSFGSEVSLPYVDGHRIGVILIRSNSPNFESSNSLMVSYVPDHVASEVNEEEAALLEEMGDFLYLDSLNGEETFIHVNIFDHSFELSGEVIDIIGEPVRYQFIESSPQEKEVMLSFRSDGLVYNVNVAVAKQNEEEALELAKDVAQSILISMTFGNR